MAKRRDARYREFLFDPVKDAYLIKEVKGKGWTWEGKKVLWWGNEDPIRLRVNQQQVSKIAKDFPSIVLNLKSDMDDPNYGKTYLFRFPFPGAGDYKADLAMDFLRQQGRNPKPTGMGSYVEYEVPHYGAEKIPHIWKYRYGKEWKPLSGPGSLGSIEYMVKGDSVRFKGSYTVYRENGEYEVPVKGDFAFHEMEGYPNDATQQSWKPTNEQINEKVHEEIGWYLEELETSADAPWNKFNTYGWDKVDDGDFSDVEFSITDNEVTVRGTVNGVPIDEIVFDAMEIDELDWDDPIESVRDHIRNMLVDLLAEMEGASLVPGLKDVRVFLESGQLSGYLPPDDLSSRMRQRVRARSERG